MAGVPRSKDGVPQWDGDSSSFQDFEEQALQWEQSVAVHKRYLCAPRLISELSGSARKHVVGKRPGWVSYEGGVAYLLRHLRECLGRPTIPELTEFLNRFFRQSRRKRFETMNQYITRKTEVYSRARQASARAQGYYDHRHHRGQHRWNEGQWRRPYSDWGGSGGWHWNNNSSAQSESLPSHQEDEHEDAQEDRDEGDDSWRDRWPVQLSVLPPIR